MSEATAKPAMTRLHRGDWVRIAKDLGPSMSHFRADCEAIVVGSYADQYGGTDHKSYTLFLKDGGETSWYDREQLTLIESGRTDKLEQWRAEKDAEIAQQSDLDWIFANGARVVEKPHGASLQALADCLGMGSLWGRNGEGMDYYANAMTVRAIATPFLLAGDKSAWLDICEQFKASKGRP